MGDSSDIQFIFGMLARHGMNYAHDRLNVSPEIAIDLISNSQVLVVTYDDTPVGAVMVDELIRGLHCEVHLLVNPDFVRPVLKGKILERILFALFDRLELRKVKTSILESNRQTHKWLMRFGFDKKCKLEDETTVAGKPAAMVLYELSRRYLFERFLPVAGPDTYWRSTKRHSLSTGVNHVIRKQQKGG